MAEEEKGTSSWYKVPTWSGNPAEWRSFKKEMSWWMASLDVESCRKYNVAARWALRQFGVVRARCEEFEPDELLGSQAITMPDPATGDETVVTPADPFAGLKKLMKALEESVGKTELDRRGELRAQFYQDMRRAPGERISAFCTRFRTLASELKREGIDLPKSELGWFLKDRMGLDAIRRQLLETALGGREEYDAVEGEALRLFRDLHAADPLQKRAFEQKPLLQRFLNNGAGSSSSHRTSMPSSASSQASTFRSFRSTPSNAASKFPQRKPFQPSQRQALIAEAPEETYEPEEEEELVPADDGDGAQAQTLEEVLQTEAEILAAEIQELEEEGSIEPQLLEELETGVEAAAESLVTMREARTKIAEVRKDRGFGKIGGGKGNANKAKQPMHGNPSQAKKVNTRCWDCGEQGHWGGDPQCGRPGAGLYRPKGKGGSNQNATKHVKITEALNTEHAVETVDRDLQPDHEVMTCDAMSWHEALNFDQNAKAKQPAELSSDKKLVGALDSACNRTCSGEVWINHYINSLSNAPQFIQNLIISSPEKEVFRFGNGGCKTSFKRYRIPMMIGDVLLCVWVSVVDVPSLGLLLGRDFLDSIGAVVSFARKMMRADLLSTPLVKLQQIAAGHFALRLAPSTWASPGAHRWRRVGQDGVVEIQVSAQEWLQRKLTAHVVSGKAEHEHLVTEQSCKAADLSHSGLVAKPHDAASQNLAHMAQDMTPLRRSTFSTTSPTTRSRACSSRDRALQPDGAFQRAKNMDDKMGKNGSKTVRAPRMARAWTALVAIATALSALPANSVPIGGKSGAMAVPMSDYGHCGLLSQEAFDQSQATECLHHEQPSRVESLRQQNGPALRISGRPSATRHDGSKVFKRNGLSTETRSSTGSSTTSTESRARKQDARCHQVACGTKRWPSALARRPDKACCTAARGGHRQDDRGGHQNLVPSSDQRLENGGKAKGRSWKWQQPSTTGCTKGGNTFTSRDVFTANCSTGSRPDQLGPASTSICTTRSTISNHAEPGHATSDGRAGQPSTAVQLGGRQHGGDGRWLDPTRDRPDQRRLLDRAQQRALRSSARGVFFGQPLRPDQMSKDVPESNPWKIHQKVRPGLSQQIAQAWQRHEHDSQLTSKSAKEIYEVMELEWEDKINGYMNETLMTAIDLSHPQDRQPILQEIFTASQRVTKEAQRRGHLTGEPLSLETGWDFRRALDRKAAFKMVKRDKPQFLVIAYPCGPWSPLMRLNPSANLEAIRSEHRQLIQFALDLARYQLRHGRHFILENPIGSASWSLPEVIKFLEEEEAKIARFDQCRFGLMSAQGKLHKKGTQMATSSLAVQARLDLVRCDGSHEHQHVIGGKHITSLAGHYPLKLAKAMVDAMEEEIMKQPQQHDVLAAEEDGDGEMSDGGSDGAVQDVPSASSDDDQPGQEQGQQHERIPAAIKHAVKRLHENTGHRSNRRLARALMISGAPAEVVRAAKLHRCSVCQEMKGPKPQRPMSLPVPKEVSDQVHIDILEAWDCAGVRYYVVHAIDHASRFQMAEVLPNKSSDSVIQWMKTRWFPIFGPPRVLVADQGKEFVSWAFERLCSENSTLLWHCAVQAPWQNGLCERAGGIIKAVLGAIIKSKSIQGSEEMNLALQEAVTAYNHDINDSGVSPSQAAIGRQP